MNRKGNEFYLFIYQQAQKIVEPLVAGAFIAFVIQGQEDRWTYFISDGNLVSKDRSQYYEL